MNTTTHPVAPEEVMAHVDGELPSIWGQFVAEHIASCEECARLAKQVRNDSDTLRAWPVQAIPESVEAKIRSAALEAGELASKFPLARLLSRERPRWKHWAFGFAGVAAVAFLLLRVGLERNSAPVSKSVRVVAGRRTEPVYGSAGPALSGEQALPVSGPAGNGGVSGDALATLTQPGVVADSNGLMHGLGDRAQTSVSLDGQPASDQQNRVFSNTIRAIPASATAAPMIARAVSLSIVAKDFAASRATLDAILARHHSYAAELTANTAENAARSLQASLRIPASELGSAIAELKSLGRVENESQNGEEVTQQHADLLARLKNSRETEQRLQAILTERTGKISDVLQVEREIARVRGEIEQMEAEQRTLEHRVEFATVNLSLSEEYKAQLVSPSPSVSTRMHNALVAGYQKASETILGFLLFFAEFGPTLVIWLAIAAVPALLLWRRYRRSLAAV